MFEISLMTNGIAAENRKFQIEKMPSQDTEKS